MFQQPVLNKISILLSKFILDRVLTKHFLPTPIRWLNTTVGTQELMGFTIFVLYFRLPDMVFKGMHRKCSGFTGADTSGEFAGFVKFADPPEGRKIWYVCEHKNLFQSIAGSIMTAGIYMISACTADSGPGIIVNYTVVITVRADVL